MLDQIDATGLIREAYAIEGIGTAECRSIFLDWAIKLPIDRDAGAAVRALLDHYGPDNPDHPMTAVLQEGLPEAAAPARRGGARGRRGGESPG